MKHKHLKRGLYTSPQSGSEQFEKYVIENETDLNAFNEAMGGLPKIMLNPMKECLEEGRIIIATDAHPLSGFPTYCFETTDKNNTHPQCYHRLKLLNSFNN